MIPRAHITAWRARAPWPSDDQVEQDLVISRALVELFSDEGLAGALAFRGGTALHKLVLPRPARYSEDIDLVQLEPGAIRPVMRSIHAHLDPWLGEPSTRQGPANVRMTYVFQAEAEPRTRRKLKVEIHTREHDAVQGLIRRDHAVANPWFEGAAPITTYRTEELLATKLRALYQRKKGRDLLDLALALEQVEFDVTATVDCFRAYTVATPITRAQFEANLAAKAADASFVSDVRPLLAPETPFDFDHALAQVRERLVAQLPGDAWRGSTTSEP